ncbi:hypothetical protein Tco_0886081 [Tanacetum coccineum]
MTGEFVSVRDALFSVTGRLRNNLFSVKTLNDHGTRGTHPRGNGHHYNEYSNLNQSMDSLKLSSNTDHLPTPAQRQSRIVAGNPMMGQNVGKGSTSVKGGIELGRGGRSAIVKNMSVEIVVPQNVIGSVYGENGTNLARLRQDTLNAEQSCDFIVLTTPWSLIGLLKGNTLIALQFIVFFLEPYRNRFVHICDFANLNRRGDFQIDLFRILVIMLYRDQPLSGATTVS